MNIIRDDRKEIEFDQSRLAKIRPKLAAAEGFELDAKQLRDIFGIEQRYLARMPERIVVPILRGRHYKEHWYRVQGWLYVLEPLEWVPLVRHGQTLSASAFKSQLTKSTKRMSETDFTTRCQAKVSLKTGGSYFGITASASLNSEVELQYSNKSITEETIMTSGLVGDQPIHELHVYPVMRCRAVSRQRIDYTINNWSDEMKWSEESYNRCYWDRIFVRDSRLDQVRSLQMHPVPIDGQGLGNKAYMLPVPQINGDGILEIVTLFSRTGWRDWYIYEKEFEPCSMTVELAAPDNDGAFRPTSSWAILSDKHLSATRRGAGSPGWDVGCWVGEATNRTDASDRGRRSKIRENEKREKGRRKDKEEGPEVAECWLYSDDE